MNAKSLIQGEESFVLVDDLLTDCVQIFRYEINSDSYDLYQTLYYKSTVKNIQVFYSGGEITKRANLSQLFQFVCLFIHRFWNQRCLRDRNY